MTAIWRTVAPLLIVGPVMLLADQTKLVAVFHSLVQTTTKLLDSTQRCLNRDIRQGFEIFIQFSGMAVADRRKLIGRSAHRPFLGKLNMTLSGRKVVPILFWFAFLALGFVTSFGVPSQPSKDALARTD
jgi:hypothetical protein